MPNPVRYSQLRRWFALAALFAVWWSVAPESVLFAQSVCLPAPRLLTTMPMGGKAGSQVEVTVSGENIEDADALTFSDPKITATRNLNADGLPIPGRYSVNIAANCPAGLYEARLMTRLGISSSRIFSVGDLTEVNQKQPNTSLASVQELNLNSVCNAATTPRSMDYYCFKGRKGQRVIVDCAARGIDSKLDPVVVIADAAGRDLVVERRSGALDFTIPEDGRYVIKVHELTFNGGPAYFYRLALWDLPADAPILRLPSTKPVNSFSWPPQGLPTQAATTEIEPNNDPARVQKITLPCDISGSFFPAADVDVFEFEARKGDVWWVEVASERLGLPTDPSILIQRVDKTGGVERSTDVAEFSDIPSPVKVSTNNYAYDGPPYQAGSSDILGKLAIQQEGVHRLQLSDLFGGTRNDPRNIYRLVIRKAAPDFAIVAWAMHMELRNGDRNALSKPIALRGGSTMALEVVTVRRDGFDGEIELFMEGLPEGVTASGLKIPAGNTRGTLLVTAKANAPCSVASVRFFGRARINGAIVERPCRLASMAWPVPDSWNEIPHPRLLADVPVSVSGIEVAPLTIAPRESTVHEVAAGGKLTIPLVQTRRGEISGGTLRLKTLGAGFEQAPPFELSLTGESSQAVLDLAKLKTPPGDYLIAFYGSTVAKYRQHPEAVLLAESKMKKAEQAVAGLDVAAKKLGEKSAGIPDEKKTDSAKDLKAMAARHKAAVAALRAAKEQLQRATQAAQPKDIADIVVSEPIVIRVKPVRSP